MKTIYIFRHGETDWNKARRLQGKTDISLNETGRAQAARLTDFFAKNPVDIFLSSDLDRAFETARIARGSLDVEIILDPRLRETNLGRAEGLTVDEVIATFGEELWNAWHHADPVRGKFRFPDGESKEEHLARVLESLQEFASATPHTKIGVASHGGAMRRLLHHLRPEMVDPIMVENCALYEITFHPETGAWVVDLEPR